jgi:hypothetical protein
MNFPAMGIEPHNFGSVFSALGNPHSLPQLKQGAVFFSA